MGQPSNGRKWKSSIAQESFSEMCKVAGLEKDQLLEEISRGQHSEYERAVLRANASRIYMSMIAQAYETASTIEANFLGLTASVTKMCSYINEE
jgi:hypothetical protein